MNLDLVKGSFYEARAGHRHEAVDILAPRNTPVRAVQAGTIAKLFFSRQGGITLYQFDPSGRLCYYYAHLQRYADNLHEGDAVAQGQVLGYVGTTGNAPPNTPHLHFAVFEVGDDRRWWKGKAIDPYPLLKSSRCEVRRTLRNGMMMGHDRRRCRHLSLAHTAPAAISLRRHLARPRCVAHAEARSPDGLPHLR